MTHELDTETAEEIDDAAEKRFHCYFANRRESPFVPFPLESMLKFDLRLRIGFVEMASLLPNVESLGFLCVPHRVVLIDESLHPCEFPELHGRLRFTYAHEIAHWCLHRNEMDVALGWMHRNPVREIVREKEANRFAGALMMPRDLLRPAWWRTFGMRTINREDLLSQRSQLIQDEITRRRFLPEGDAALEKLMFEGAVSGLANQFGVSPWAMRIRCEQLGLIVR